MDVILFGPPGAGKGTQAAAIIDHLKIPQVATGDIFRKHLKDGTPLGKLAKSYMDSGALVPDEVVCDIVASRLAEDDAQKGTLLDGFPRTVAQAELLDKWLRDHGRRIDAVISLVVDDKALVARLSARRTCPNDGSTYHLVNSPPEREGICDACGGPLIQREDDREATIRERLRVYREQTEPVLAWLEGKAAIRTIDGQQPIGVVRKQILDALDALGLSSREGG
jgi:adenylate kinase